MPRWSWRRRPISNARCDKRSIFPPSNTVVFGDIERVHVRADLLDGTRVDPFGLRAVGRLAGSGYSRTVDGYFEMDRTAS